MEKNLYLLKKQDKKYFYLSCPNTTLIYQNEEYVGLNFKCKIINNTYIFTIESFIIEITLSLNNNLQVKTSHNGFILKNNGGCVKGLIKHPKELFLRCNNRFIALMKSNQEPVLLINPLVGYQGDTTKMIMCNYHLLSDEEIEFELLANSCDYFKFEIDAYTPKLIFDNMIENIKVDRNNVFTSVAFLQNDERKEEYMLRFNYIKMSELLDKQIKKAFLYIKILDKSNDVLIIIEEIQAMWCSFATNWLKQPHSIDNPTTVKINNNYLKIDVRKYINLFATRKDLNHPGFIIKVIAGKMTLATSDSYYYPILLEIELV